MNDPILESLVDSLCSMADWLRDQADRLTETAGAVRLDRPDGVDASDVAVAVLRALDTSALVTTGGAALLAAVRVGEER